VVLEDGLTSVPALLTAICPDPEALHPIPLPSPSRPAILQGSAAKSDHPLPTWLSPPAIPEKARLQKTFTTADRCFKARCSATGALTECLCQAGTSSRTLCCFLQPTRLRVPRIPSTRLQCFVLREFISLSRISRLPGRLRLRSCGVFAKAS